MEIRRLGVLVVLASLALSPGKADAASFSGLGDSPPGSNRSLAWGISSDGTTVVGAGGTYLDPVAFIWDVGVGMQGLDDLPGGGSTGGAFDVSADGSIAVGFGTSDSGPEATIWSAGGVV